MLTLPEYVVARQRATERRRAGGPRPWSEDPVIAEKFLCSVIRDDDRTSREAREYIQHGAHPEADRAALARCFRYFNWVPTLVAMQQAIVSGQTCTVPMVAELMRAKERQGEKFLGAQAFKINVKGGVWNIDGIADMVVRLYTSKWVRPLPTIRAQVQDLIDRKVGPFMAYQIAQDMRWVQGPFEDEDRWALVGPGAARGLQRYTGTYGGHRTWEERRFDNRTIAMQGVSMPQEMREILPIILDEVRAALRLAALPGLPPERFNMLELEHNLCEWDKYCRIATGESKGRRYTPRPD